VLIVADSSVLRAGLRVMLAQDAGLVLVAEARDVTEATDRARETHPDVAIVDVREPGEIDVRACQEFRTQGGGCNVLILTARSDEETIIDLIMDGASGYLSEDLSAAELHDAIRTVYQGGSPVDPKVSAVIAGRLRLRSLGDQSPLAPLSVDEFQVLERIVRGETNRQIGKALRLDDKVVKHRISNILKKINAKNRVAAAAWWARQHQADMIDDPTRG
jgi:two-component system NarL family response regulator/two-component system response regulator DevR